MRLAVTGVTGFVGSAFFRLARSLGHDVLVLGRNQGHARNSQNFDLDDEQKFKIDWRDVEALVHFATRIPTNQNSIDEINRCFRANAVGSLRLIADAIDAGVKRVIHTVSANAYAPEVLYPDEQAQMLPVRRAPYYLVSKIAQEAFAAHRCASSGVPLVTLRLSSVFGVGQKTGAFPAIARKLSNGEIVVLENGGRFGSDFVDVRDVASTVISALDPDIPSGAFNVGSGIRTTMNDVSLTIAAVLGRSPDNIVLGALDPKADVGFPAMNIEKAKTYLRLNPRSFLDSVGSYFEGVRSS